MTFWEDRCTVLKHCPQWLLPTVQQEGGFGPGQPHASLVLLSPKSLSTSTPKHLSLVPTPPYL